MKAIKFSEVVKGKIAIIIMIILVILLYMYGNYFSRSLTKNFIVTQGQVTEAGFASKIGGYTHFNFVINGELYKGSQSLPKLKHMEERFIIVDKTFPVVVDSTNYSNAIMLFDSLSFVQFGLKYSDSVRWFKNYLK